jgi:hypothetical protein
VDGSTRDAGRTPTVESTILKRIVPILVRYQLNSYCPCKHVSSVGDLYENSTTTTSRSQRMTACEMQCPGHIGSVLTAWIAAREGK